MLIIGLTGSIGMGKSTAAARFRDNGIPVIDADALVHDLYRGGAVALVEAAFPGVAVDNQIDRQRLSAKLIADPTGFKTLERIVHPLVRSAERQALHSAMGRGTEMTVLEVPLLFESGGETKVDVTVVVSASPEIQRQRVLSRAGMTAEKLEAILARQLPDSQKRARANFVVDTSGEVAATHAQIDAIILALRGRIASAFSTHWS